MQITCVIKLYIPANICLHMPTSCALYTSSQKNPGFVFWEVEETYASSPTPYRVSKRRGWFLRISGSNDFTALHVAQIKKHIENK